MSAQPFPPTPPEEVGPRKKRKRLALSCTACKSSKIRCDRQVPNCSSCIARGIQRNCRWGDERDTSIDPNLQQKTTSPSTNVDIVVDQVLKRLQSREVVDSPSGSASSCSFSNLSKRSNPVHAAANIIKTFAFVPNNADALDSRFPRPALQDSYVDVERLKTSLRTLPSRTAVEKLLELYLSELEPFRCAFNQVILRQQLDEFWLGVDELNIEGQNLVWPSNEQRRYPDPFFPAQDEFITTSDAASPLMLTTMTRQGLIALVFSLIYATLSSLHYHKKVQMGIFPSSFTEKEVDKWSDEYHHLSRLHLNLSKYIEHPTLWTIQILLLHTAYYMDHRAIRVSQVNLSVILRLCVSLGLSRLGSAVDDARAMQEAPKAKSPYIASAEEEDEKRINVTSNSFGVTMSSFEEGNLALRELGRKLWTMIVAVDFTMGAHMDSHYSTHDNINHTSPPSAIDDDKILTATAPSLLLSRSYNSEMSQNAFPGCCLAIARAGRLQVELENTEGSPLSYKDILRVDREYKLAVSSFPHYYHYKSFKGEYSLSRQIIIQRNALHEQVQFRLLRLHRLHMGKGFKDAHYLPSLNACFYASKVIVQARIELEKLVIHSRRMIGYQIHLLHAALVVHLILMFELSQREEELQSGKQRLKGYFRLENTDEAIEQLEVALNILRFHSTSSKDWPRGLDKLDNFLQRVKSQTFSKVMVPTLPSLQQQYQSQLPQSPRFAAADILASIPSSTFTTSAESSSYSANLFDPILSNIDTSTLWSNDLDSDLWSLNALFPDYATNSIDLVDALEKVVWS